MEILDEVIADMAGDWLMLESRTAKHKTHYGWHYLWTVPLITAGVIIYSFWPRATVTASSNALARVSLNGRLASAIAMGPHGQQIQLTAKNGQLWPLSSMEAGVPYTIRLRITGPSWWPFGPTTISKTLVTPQDPSVTANELTVIPGHPVALSLSSPASILHIIMNNRQRAIIRSTVPQLIYSIHSPGTAPGEQGTLTVQTQARAWESVSTPKTLSWRTPNWLKVVASPNVNLPLGLTQPLTLNFTHAVEPSHLIPKISPQIAGQWIWKSPTTEQFIPSSSWGYGPDQVVTVTIPGGPNGYHSAQGAYFPNNVTVSWSTAPGSTLRLQELLAKLGYLPLKWIPNTPVPDTLSAQIAAMMNAPSGQFQWEYSNTPATLQSFWIPGQYTVMVKGAVMNFERVHNLPVDGIAGPQVWRDLIQADLGDQMNPDGYSYVYVSENLPETLTLWHNGKIVLKSLANTGIPQAPTYIGTYPVYQRYLSQTMQGVNPNGVPYYDPGVPYVNYFKGGDAVHGFPRAKYGFPQSLGCVELPIPVAAKVWPYLHYGTLVTVAPPTSPSSSSAAAS